MGQEEDVAVGKLLLKFAGETLLDLVEIGEQRDGDEDDNGAFSTSDFELYKSDVRTGDTENKFKMSSSSVPHEPSGSVAVSEQP